MTDRIFGQGLLEGDSVNPNFFFMLAKENKKELRSCVVQIPPTVLFEQGFAKAVFATESIRGQTGEVKKKVGRDVDIDDVYEMMTKGTPERSLCAVLIYAPPKSNEMTAVRFLDKAGVKDYIYHEIEKPKSLLQRFIMPKGNNNTLIHATWSPLLLLAEGRRCTHSLNDTHLDPNKRGITFEDPNSTSVNVVVSKTVIQSVTEMCHVVAQHFDKAERLSLNRMSAYFKVDANSKLHLLYSTSLRFENNVSHNNPISLDLGVKISEDTKKSVVKTGSGILRGHDPIEAMDMALRDADEKNKTMLVTVPSIPDNTTLLLKTLRGHKVKTVSPERLGDTRKSPTIRSPTSPARSGSGFPDVQLPPSFAQHQQAVKAATLPSSPAQSSASLLVGSPKSAAKNQQQSAGAAEELLNPASGDAKYFTLSKGAALPQPKPLMKVQHLLPNSPQNLKVALSTISEETIQIEWAKFLQLQNREIQKIRIRDAQRAAEQAKEAAHDANRRSDNVDNGAAPPAKIHSWFDYRQPDKKKDETVFGSDSPVAPGTAGSEGRRSKSTQLTILEVDPAVEQQEFMNYLREQLAKKMLDDKERIDKQQLQQHHQEGEDLEEDPRFVYLNRESKQRMAMPHDYSATKSTLLPPVFRHSAPEGNSKQNAKQHARSPSPQKTKTIGQVSPSSSKIVAARTPDPGKSSGPSVLSSPVPSVKHGPASPPSPAPFANSSDPPPAQDGVASGPSSRRGSYFASAGVSEEQQAAIMQRKQAQAQAVAAKRSLSVARLQEILQFNREEEQRAREKRDHISELTDTRCRAPVPFDDLGGLSEDEIAAVDSAAVDWCERFRYFMQDLLYSMHEVFLIGASSIYLEIPLEFAEIVSLQTVTHILHKLHGKVEQRRSWLQTNCPDSLNGNIDQFRSDQLKALQEFALGNSTFEKLTTQQLLADADTQCIVFPLLPAYGLNIVREESFVVLEDVVPYVDRERCGVVYNNALKACYFKHLGTVKGAKAAALEMQRVAEAQERADRLIREETHNSHIRNSNSLISVGDSGDDADDNHFTHAPQGPPASPSLTLGDSSSLPAVSKKPQASHASLRTSTSGNGDTSNVSRTGPEGKRDSVVSASATAESSNINDVVCPRCNTCRVCCVCGLVYGNPGTLWKPNKKKR